MKTNTKKDNINTKADQEFENIIVRLASSAHSIDEILDFQFLNWALHKKDKNKSQLVLPSKIAKSVSDFDQLAKNSKALIELKKIIATKIQNIREDRAKELSAKADRKPRLADFRKVLKQNKIDFFLLKRGDKFLGEYIGDDWQCLAWLTGFSGSHGYAVIGHKDAYVFVDSRYTEQAKIQVNSKLFKIVDFTGYKDFNQWLANNLSGSVVGFDKSLVAADFAQQLLNNDNNIHYKPITDPFASIWSNRPEPAISRLFIQSNSYSGKTAKAKIQIVVDYLVKNKIDSYLITKSDSISYLLNLRARDIPYNPVINSFLIVNKDKSLEWFIDEKKLSKPIYKYLNNLDIKFLELDKINQTLISKNKSKIKIACARSETPYALYNLINKKNVINFGLDFVADMKCKKFPDEVKGAKLASIHDSLAFIKLFAWIDNNKHKKLTERKIKSQLEVIRKTNRNYLFQSFNTISAANANSALPHYSSGPNHDKPIPQNSIYLLDAGGHYISSTTDQTRTIYLGKKPTKQMKKVYTYVLKAHLVMTSQLFAKNVTGGQVDANVRAKLWQVAMDFKHGTGHGIGNFLNVHEGPIYINQIETKQIVPNLIVSNEPGHYIVNHFGVRIENLVIAKIEKVSSVEMIKFENLSYIPYERKLIDKTLLTSDEIDQINRYHKKVSSICSDYKLDNTVATWLKQATAKI